MKKIKILSVTAVAILFLSSCVSSRKYNDALSSKMNTEKMYNEMQVENSNLKTENKNLNDEKKRLQIANDYEKTALNEREAALTAEEQKMKNMQSLVNEEKQAIINLKQEVCSALKCF